MPFENNFASWKRLYQEQGPSCEVWSRALDEFKRPMLYRSGRSAISDGRPLATLLKSKTTPPQDILAELGRLIGRGALVVHKMPAERKGPASIHGFKLTRRYLQLRKSLGHDDAIGRITQEFGESESTVKRAKNYWGPKLDKAKKAPKFPIGLKIIDGKIFYEDEK